MLTDEFKRQKTVIYTAAVCLAAIVGAIAVFRSFKEGFKIESYSVKFEEQTQRYEPRYPGGYEYDFVILHADQRISGKCLSANKCRELANKVGERIFKPRIDNWASTNDLEYHASYGESELIEVIEIRDLHSNWP